MKTIKNIMIAALMMLASVSQAQLHKDPYTIHITGQNSINPYTNESYNDEYADFYIVASFIHNKDGSLHCRIAFISSEEEWSVIGELYYRHVDVRKIKGNLIVVDISDDEYGRSTLLLGHDSKIGAVLTEYDYKADRYTHRMYGELTH